VRYQSIIEITMIICIRNKVMKKLNPYITNKDSCTYFKRVDEIDFLRAFAVLGVVCSHIGVLKGGFIGVDIFFAISGYVITLSIIKDKSSFRRRIADFYHHRIRRIIPPLFFASLFMFILIRLLIVDADDYSFLIKTFKYQSFFAHNLYFAAQSAEYFHGLSEAKFNLHLWSIAVEEQFYIVFPFILILLYRNSRIRLTAFVLLLMSIVSLKTFSLNQYGRYYLIYSRAWELFAGSIACLLSNYLYSENDRMKHLNRYLFLNPYMIAINILIIGASMLMVEPTLSWPCGTTLLPIFATTMLMVQFHLFPLGAHGPSLNRKTTSIAGFKLLRLIITNPVFGYIGKSSYSIYLYHWPIFAAMVYLDYQYGSKPYDFIVYLIVLFVCSHSSYVLLEKNKMLITKKWSLWILICFIAFCYGIGMESFFAPAFASKNAKEIIETGKFSGDCSICVEKPGKDFIILWGDSHARALMNSIESYCIKHAYDLVFITPIALIDENKSHARISDLIKKSTFKGMILASRWSMYLGFQEDEPEEQGTRYISIDRVYPRNKKEAAKSFEIAYRRLFAEGLIKRAVIVLQVPRYPFFPVKEALLESRGLKFRKLPEKTLEQHRKEQNLANRILCSVNSNEFVTADPSDILCQGGFCRWRNGDTLLYKDDDHLSVAGADLIMPLIEESIEKVQSHSHSPSLHD
jgi:peptidoglycan/LPS O-acetylase OafA/YrhL